MTPNPNTDLWEALSSRRPPAAAAAPPPPFSMYLCRCVPGLGLEVLSAMPHKLLHLRQSPLTVASAEGDHVTFFDISRSSSALGTRFIKVLLPTVLGDTSGTSEGMWLAPSTVEPVLMGLAESEKITLGMGLMDDLATGKRLKSSGNAQVARLNDLTQLSNAGPSNDSFQANLMVLTRLGVVAPISA